MISPLKSKDKRDENSWIEIAKYDFDVGLEVSDLLKIREICFGGELFSFSAMVVRKTKIIQPQEDGAALFSIDILVEVIDKEKLSSLREIFRLMDLDKLES
jgi:hypothetical protein